MKLVVSMVAAAGLATCAFADPVAVISIISDVTNTTVAGNFGTTPTVYTDATRYHYYTFTANAGSTVNFSASRTTSELDPTIIIFQGNMDGTILDGSNPFDVNPSPWLGFTQVGFADDEIEVPGPFGDPVGSFVATAGGTYTLVILSNASNDPGPNGLGYTLTVTPTPTAAAVFGLAGVAGLRRRRR